MNNTRDSINFNQLT